MIGIYKITNQVNRKVYIGQSWDIEKRYNWSSEEDVLKRSTNSHLKSSFKKYGLENFSFEVLYETTQVESLDEDMIQLKLNMMEMSYIDHFKSYDPKYGYNKTYGGEGGRPTEETRRKKSESTKGNNNPMYGKNPFSKKTQEEMNIIKKKISESNIGRNVSEETRKKISEANKGMRHSEETKRKLSDINKGKKLSEETKRKIREANKNISEETRRKISEAVKKNLEENPETRKKLSEKSKGKRHSEETKRKISETKKSKMRRKIF